MCRINCSGGCPECAPEEHKEHCVSNWEGGATFCSCVPAKYRKAYTKGEEARSLSHDREYNPYNRGSNSWHYWLKGWEDENGRGY